MNDLPTHKDGLCAWRKRGSHFNLSFRGIFLPAFEAQSAPGHILARHDIFAERVTPDACLEIHLVRTCLRLFSTRGAVCSAGAGSAGAGGGTLPGFPLSSDSSVAVSNATGSSPASSIGRLQYVDAPQFLQVRTIPSLTR